MILPIWGKLYYLCKNFFIFKKWGCCCCCCCRFSRVRLCDPIDGSPSGSPVPGILQARTLEWVAISFSNAWKWKVKGKSLSRVWLLATPWTAAHQAPRSMGFSRQEYWSGLPLPSPKMRLNYTYFTDVEWEKIYTKAPNALRDCLRSNISFLFLFS